jgi:Rps23 Pro-64 3,4-dihydroxylase Tpa1-like proline 4-hydroxylase
VNTQPYDYEVLDLGLVYYKNALENPQLIIDSVESLDERISESVLDKTIARKWTPWINESSLNKETFCMQKFIPQANHINKKDFFYDEVFDISTKLFGALDNALEHYSTELYPFAKKNIKSREDSMHLLRYEESGYLPQHQDQGVSTRVLSVLLYLNDDYEGGNIMFRHSGVSIKPVAGSLIFFPSNFLYVHEVAPVTGGRRYSLPNWYHNIERNKINNSTGEE